MDNLKLGYGGTQEEMQRLLNDAQKITGVKYDMKNLSDVYSAIHVIQDNLGVTGTTAEEASKTFSGSFSAMKASAQNLLGNLAIGGDVSSSMEQLVDTASTFLLGEGGLFFMVGNVLSSLPSAVKKASPKIMEAGKEIAKSLKEGLIAMLPASVGGAFETAFDSIGNIAGTMAPVVQQMGEMFGRVAPVIADTLGGAFANSGGFIESFAGMISSAIPVAENLLLGLVDVVSYLMPVIQGLGGVFASVFPVVLNVVNSVIPIVTTIVQAFASVIQLAFPVVENIIQIFSNVISTIFPVIQNIFQGLGDKVAQIVGVIQSHMGLVQGVFETVSPIIQGAIEIIASVLSTAWDIISPIVDLAIVILDAILTKVEEVFPTIQGIIESVWGFLEPIFNAIADGLSAVGDAIGSVASWIGDKISGGNSKSHAYGMNRVPYDNYPANLHQGEMVLTRNQADQYDRSMSTRGVQLGESPVSLAQGGTSANTGGTTVNIEKLADTVVIEKEADVDKVVEDMITKFRKLVPNMA